MTVRQRQASGSAAAVGANGSEAGQDRSAHFSWEDWFRHASAQQRAEALGLAQQQGVLYPHQLPAVSNGVKPAGSPQRDTEASNAVARLLAGKSETLPSLSFEAISFFDSDLDELQQQAVARALATPDLFLLEGLPGTGKSRVLVEIVRQAAARGQRVLFLAAHHASLDVVLERLCDRPDVLALRFFDVHEKTALPATLRAFTLEQQQKAFVERTLAGARGKQEQAEAARRRRGEQEAVWPQLRACLASCLEVNGRLQALDAQIAALGDVVRREAESSATGSAFAARVSVVRQARQDALHAAVAAVTAQQDLLAQCEREITDVATQIARIEPGYLAKKHGRFWTFAYWTNLFNGGILAQMDGLVEQQTKAQGRRQEIAREIDRAAEEQNRLREQLDAEIAAVIDAEVQVRRQALLCERQVLAEEQRKDEDAWSALCRRLDLDALDKSLAATEAAQQSWLDQRQVDDQQIQFAQQWLKFVEAAGSQLAAKLTTFANLLAGTIACWNADAKFRDAAAAPADLVIVEDADGLSETDVLKLARLGRRCILVAQAIAEPVPAPAPEKSPRPFLITAPVPAACWHRLWTALGGDAGRWPCRWRREDGRLVCQLIPLAAEDCQHLEMEGLADTPDIELHILHWPRTRPCLAKVVFPPNGTFADAFTFMVREVQDFPLETIGVTAWWSEDAQHHVRRLGGNAGRIHAWLELEPGLRLGAVADHTGEACRIAAIEFDKSAGWDRGKAESWLQRYRPIKDHERTAFLQTPYRFEHSLIHVVQTMVRADEWRPNGAVETPSNGQAFEFIAVPPFAKRDWPREGAGLELDLAGARQADRLPVGLRHGLPQRGFVNYLEAQALIRRLEAWLRENPASTCRVAVLALYDGQVELLRRLVEQSEILRARTFPLEVAMPSRLHQRECDVVFLSLTRSHTHRATAFGDDVKELPLAWTRGRSRLFVFGDPGAVCKRAAWHGPVDQLDAACAQQEMVRMARLLASLQKQLAAAPHGNGKE